MKHVYTACVVASLYTPSALGSPKHPICKNDVSTLSLSTRAYVSKQIVEQGFRPGVGAAHRDVCRCLPRQKRKQPAVLLSRIHLQPNTGQIRLTHEYTGPYTRRIAKMLQCLGAPRWTIDPIPYVTDMVNDGHPILETLTYPVKWLLWDPSAGAPS